MGSYPCPSNISYLYNYGFLLGMCIILQIITGICLSMHYISHISYSFFDINIQMEHLLHFLLLILTLLDLLYYNLIFIYLILGLQFILPFLVMCLLLFHIFYLHLLGSSNPLGSINTNNKVTFFSYILNKDIYGFLILFTLYCMQLG